jgi:hypothetical protein
LITEIFEEVATVVDALICGGFELKSEPVRDIHGYVLG